MRLLTIIRAMTPMMLAASVFVAAPIAGAQFSDGNGVGSQQSVCPNTITGRIYIAGCLPSVNPPASAVSERGTGQVPLLYGIPCTGSNFGKCIGLSRLPATTPP